MEYFCNSTPDIIKYVGSAIMPGILFENDFEPIVRRVHRDFIGVRFPKSVINRLLSDDPTPELSDVESDVKEFLAEATAFLATWQRSISAKVTQTGSGGLFKMENDKFSRSYKYESVEYDEDKEDKGFFALESAAYLAVANKANVEGFADTAPYKAATSGLVNFAQDFTEGSLYRFNYRTFATLRQPIGLIERQVVAPMLGKTLYTDLKTNQYSLEDTKLSPNKRFLIQLLRRGIAAHAVALSMEANLVQLIGDAVAVISRKNDDAKNQHTPPSRDILAIAMQNRIEYAQRYFTEAQQFLEDNAEDLGWTTPVPPSVVADTTVQIGVKTL